MWPGGWATDQHGELAFVIRDSQELPLWACPLCRGGLLHTLAEHDLLLRGAAR
jgi:hypothetical protein